MAPPLIFSYTLQDYNDMKTSTRLYYAPTDPATVTLAQIVADWTSYGTALDACTNAQIQQGTISVPELPDAGWKNAPVDQNDDADVLTLNFANASNLTKFGVLINAYLESFVSAGNIDISSAELVALLAVIQGGLANGAFVNPTGQALTTLSDYFLTDRSNVRKKLKQRSRRQV